MAKYLVTNSSYFKPFSYEELLKPIMHAEEVHNATQDAYDTLNLETEALRQYISEEGADDQQARKLYDNYTNKLKTLQENLWNNGVNAQTRRDLAAARAGYASDITRLQKAIQTRQERSQEYWKMRHANPDLIMGSDPGSSGLDNYLNNDNYGQNYFTLDGNKFMQSVGIEAKARAGQMLSDPQIKKIPGLEGYLNMIVSQGFSTKQVDDASTAVQEYMKGSDTEYKQLDPGAKILADVLMTNINNSGAVGNVSPEELVRLFDYGRRGLSTAIAEPKQQTVSDLVWKSNREYYDWERRFNKQQEANERLAAMKAAASGKASGKSDGSGSGYLISSVPTQLIAPGSDDITKQLRDKFVKPFEKPIKHSFMYKGKEKHYIESPLEAEAVLDGFGKAAVKNKYGIDIDDLIENTKAEGVYNGQPIKVVLVANNPSDYSAGGSYKVVFQNSEEANDDPQVLAFDLNKAVQDYKQSIKDFNKENNTDLRKLAMKKSDWDKLYSKNNIDSSVSHEDAYSILTMRSEPFEAVPASILDNHQESDYNYLRTMLADNMITASAGAPKVEKGRHKGSVSPTGNYVLYPVDGLKYSDEGITVEEAFGTDSSGINNKKLLGLTAFPEDLLRGQVRITLQNGKQYMIFPSMADNALKNLVDYQRGFITDAMLPFMNPNAALNLSDAENFVWLQEMRTFLGSFFTQLMYYNDQGQIDYYSPADIIRDKDARAAFRSAITNHLNSVFAEYRDNFVKPRKESYNSQFETDYE